MKWFIASAMLATATIAQASSISPTLQFSVKNGATGAVYKMAEHPNSVFVFESFSLSCGYCNDNAPAVDRLAKDYKDNARVQVLDTGLDTSDSYYKEWIRRHNPNHPVVADPARQVFNALETENGIPQVFVVNCKGEMVGNYVGAWDSSAEKEVRSLVNKGLETSCQ